jgi:thiosulfate reductase cytochrome b subunit
MFLGVLLGVAGHGSLRFYTSLRNKPKSMKMKKVYMYSVYERLWHWLQTLSIVLLLFTGLIIHKPDLFGIFSFNGMVVMHNVLATILAVNAIFALFYHLASGEIKQFLPEPHGFFGQSIQQAKFYLRGIFKGNPHPFEKTVDKKMNPLQQVTYVAILNVLLPLQGITGILMWGAQRWPEIANQLGGLPFLAPFHTLVAWSFAAFIVMHVYLTTTGHTPLAGIRAMMLGWENVETHEILSEEEPEA